MNIRQPYYLKKLKIKRYICAYKNEKNFLGWNALSSYFQGDISSKEWNKKIWILSYWLSFPNRKWIWHLFHRWPSSSRNRFLNPSCYVGLNDFRNTLLKPNTLQERKMCLLIFSPGQMFQPKSTCTFWDIIFLWKKDRK